MLFLDYVRDLEKQLERVRELAEAFVTAGYQGDWTGVEIKAAILDALDGEK